MLPFAHETSFFSEFLHGFKGSKGSSGLGGAIRDITTTMYIGISVNETVKSPCISS